MKEIRRAVCVALACASFFVVVPAWGAQIDPDPEAHRTIGSLYALALAVALEGGDALPGPARLSRWIDGPLADMGLTETGGAWWADVPVGRFSTARRALRRWASDLGIVDAPGGRPWLGGDRAWLKVADVAGQGRKRTIEPIPLRAALGENEELFLAPEGSDIWWHASPMLTRAAREAASSRWGVYVPGLRAPTEPKGEDALKASPVRKPDDIHLGREADPLSVEMGDMIFTPIPRPRER